MQDGAKLGDALGPHARDRGEVCLGGRDQRRHRAEAFSQEASNVGAKPRRALQQKGELGDMWQPRRFSTP